MEEIVKPLAFHLQQLRVELQCPVCLSLPTNPVVLPCDHALCCFCVPTSYKCPLCTLPFAAPELRAAPHVEGMIAIYRSFNATFNSRFSSLSLTCDLNNKSTNLQQSVNDLNKEVDNGICAFCFSSQITEETGPIEYHYKAVVEGVTSPSEAIPVHSSCIDWASELDFDGETITDLEAELARAAKIKCSGCGLKGASLGCSMESCQRSYHMPCALEIQDCQWDSDNFVMLCPRHKFITLNYDSSSVEDIEPSMSVSCGESEQSSFWASEWILCASGLSREEKHMLTELAEVSGATVCNSWKPGVTHVIAGTDEKGACARITKSYLMAILSGRWILTMDWIRACIEANGPVNEEAYEISMDSWGFVGGPKAGRLRASTDGPELFGRLMLYVMGDQYEDESKSDLFQLVDLGGGYIFDTEEELEKACAESDEDTDILVVYNDDSRSSGTVRRNRAEAQRLAKKIFCQAIPLSWIFLSIAACRLQEY